MSGVIVHKSRPDEVEISYANTENVLSWPAKFNDDGEIYDVQLTNVATYAINGVPQNISALSPYLVVAGISYSVSVTKTTNGMFSKIVLISRRSVKKTTSVIVPDYSLPGNGYLYALLDNNTVIKRDPLLITTPYYSGSGVWSQSSIVSTISLPTNGGLISWKYICYDAGDIICWGRSTATGLSKLYVCRIKPNGDVYDYFNVTLNGYWESTSSVLNSLNNHYPYAVGNDYVNGYFAVSPYSTSGSAAGFWVKKGDMSIIGGSLVIANYARQIYFNPIRSVFPLVGDVMSPQNRVTNLFYVNNYTGFSAFSINRNRTIKANSNSYAIIWEFNEYGQTLSSYGCTGTGESSNGNPGNIAHNKRLDISLSISANQSSFALCNYLGTLKLSRRITTFAETALGSRYVAVNERSSQFFATLSHASHLNKILVIDPNDANVEVGYIQESSNILCVCTNNHY